MSDTKPTPSQQKVTLQSNDNVLLEVGMRNPAKTPAQQKPKNETPSLTKNSI